MYTVGINPVMPSGTANPFVNPLWLELIPRESGKVGLVQKRSLPRWYASDVMRALNSTLVITITSGDSTVVETVHI